MEIFEKLKAEVNNLHFHWMIYRQVFAQGPEEIELLNENGAYFFHITQYLFLDNVSLAFSKLTDPNRQGKNENLSLKQLIVKANEAEKPELVNELKEKFNRLKNSCENFRKLRNKRIAHADLEHAIGTNKELLPGISRQYIEDALALLRDFMNTFELVINDSQTLYEELILKPGYGGDVLMRSLKKAKDK
ncbi:AbiU2 domain-containing protein [Shewanella woodyi]|uniref:AbiU2 domain-containing protein n=1 Tax=Shewanella woodyi TaxID=60961 RepID=UPI0007F95022|nr:hypothetical protein [Shewanella woodyi]